MRVILCVLHVAVILDREGSAWRSRKVVAVFSEGVSLCSTSKGGIQKALLKIVVQSRLSQYTLTACCMNIRSRSGNNELDTPEKA